MPHERCMIFGIGCGMLGVRKAHGQNYTGRGYLLA